MIIEKNVKPYCIGCDEPIRNALQRIDDNKSGFVFCVNHDGFLRGMLTDGDFRRSLLEKSLLNLNDPVTTVANTEYKSMLFTSSRQTITRQLSTRIKMIPLLDDHGHLIAIACKKDAREGLHIAGHVINETSPVFVIAEVGINHNGSVETAKQLVDAAKASGFDCVKFQMRCMDAIYRRSSQGLADEDLSAQYIITVLDKFDLPPEDMIEIFNYCKDVDILPLCTPWDYSSLQVLEEYQMPAYKVASADLTNHPFLKVLTETCKPLIVSTGMSTENEIQEAVRIFKDEGNAYALLQCNSTYPAPLKDVNLRYMDRLKDIGACQVGYSGHEKGYHVATAAVALGAKILEKHITLDRNMEGPDHKVSLLPHEMKDFISQVRDVELSLGQSTERLLSQGEIMNRSNLAKSLIAKCAINKGDIIQRDIIDIKGPGRGVQPNKIEMLVGRMINRDMKPGDFFFPSDLMDSNISARHYSFSRPWGITVRWHDFREMLALTNPDFLEFHLSFRDMDEDYLLFFKEPIRTALKVHSPDTFAGDHLLDLSNENKEHRLRSITELQRVTKLTRELIPYFDSDVQPQIIVSLGGYSTDSFISPQDVKRRYDILSESLQKIDMTDVEVIGQTLPPFPWYFGGRMYLNLFVKAQDTFEFCKSTGIRLCFDICHSKLTCNYYNTSFREFTKIISPYIAHLHISDAQGVDGEGLQIDDGDIDFYALKEDLAQYCPTASFIPEIWQGHKNKGEGFWVALDKLEQLNF